MLSTYQKKQIRFAASGIAVIVYKQGEILLIDSDDDFQDLYRDYSMFVNGYQYKVNIERP